MRERAPVYLSTEVAADGRLFAGRRGLWENELGLRLIAFGCALFLLLAILMPNWLARTSWSRASRKNAFMGLVDSPASYVGLVSVCGLIAFFALTVGLWRRWAVAAVLVAAAAFAYGAYVIGSFWLGLSHGVILLDGRPAQEMGPPKWTVHWPPMLPLFAIAAVIGAISALVLAVSWLRQPKGV